MSSTERREIAPYTRLAPIYDEVMAHVDYRGWAEYIAALIDAYHPSAKRILELGCGTGTLAYHLQPMGGFEYLATDISPNMIDVGKAKPEAEVTDVAFAVRDFRKRHDIPPVDVVLLLYDSINYMLEKSQVDSVLSVMHDALSPGGIAVFDQATPINSIENEQEFSDQGRGYIRKSWYDSDENIHTTVFELYQDDAIHVETHQQRAYEISEIEARLQASPFRIVASLHERTRKPATENSQRVHWVVQKRPNPRKAL